MAMSNDQTRDLSQTPTSGRSGEDPGRPGHPPAGEQLTHPGSQFDVVATGLSVTFDLPGSGSGPCSEAVVPEACSGGSQADATLPKGTRLGHFEIEYRLGSGGMGQVYRAVDRSLRRPVAVKVLTAAVAGGDRELDQEMERLLQEAVTQASLPHPNVVPIYYVGKQDGAPFLAMELVGGQTLHQRLAGGPLPFEQVVSIALQITDALQFAHSRDLIHGDIKPSNILVQDNLLAKLSDFGMARRASGDTSLPVGGTPNYLAPELLTGGQPTLQSDIYALGITLYEMTFGERPVKLSGRSLAEWAESHRQQQLSFPSPWPESVPESWQQILRRMLAADPAARYSGYAALRSDLLRVAPTSQAPARWLPRMIAAQVDYGIVILLTSLLAVVGWMLVRLVGGWLNVNDWTILGLFQGGSPWYTDTAMAGLELLYYAALYLPIVLHTAGIWIWRHSVGRELMHVQVVNRFGLTPGRRLMTLRSLMRMMPLWFFPLLFMSGLGSWLPVVGGFLAGASAIFIVISMAMMILTPSGRAIHDRILKTRVVFGSAN